MLKQILLVAGLVLCALGVPASAQTSQTLPIIVTVLPNYITIASGATEQYSVTVLNTTNPAVTWSACSPATISSTGLFAAPVVTESTSFCVSATSAADPSKTATVFVNVTPPAVTPMTISLAIAEGPCVLMPSTGLCMRGYQVLFAMSGAAAAGDYLVSEVWSCGTSGDANNFSATLPVTSSGKLSAGLASFQTGQVCTYPGPGTYSAVLTMRDSLGKTISETVPLTVSFVTQAPKAANK